LYLALSTSSVILSIYSRCKIFLFISYAPSFTSHPLNSSIMFTCSIILSLSSLLLSSYSDHAPLTRLTRFYFRWLRREKEMYVYVVMGAHHIFFINGTYLMMFTFTLSPWPSFFFSLFRCDCKTDWTTLNKGVVRKDKIKKLLQVSLDIIRRMKVKSFTY
jgi:hypothetical protein